MAGRNKWNNLVERMSPERRARIAQGVREDLTEMLISSDPVSLSDSPTFRIPSGTPIVKFALIGKGASSLLVDLDSAGIEYSRRIPKIGVFLNSGAVIEFIGSVPWGKIAIVLIAWINAKPSRKIQITDKNHKTFEATGYSTDEVERLLKVSESVKVFDTKSEGEKMASTESVIE